MSRSRSHVLSSTLCTIACTIVSTVVATVVLGALAPTRSAAQQRVAEANGELLDPASITICLQPLGRYDRKLLETAMRGIRYVYGFSTKKLKARKMPRSAYYKPRKRYRAEKLLDYLNDKVKTDDCFAVIGFTKLDISTTKGKRHDWGILGLGEVGGTAAVVSSHRLTRKASRRKLKKRTVKVVNHELGHVLGLDHYDDEAGCVMNDARGTVRTVDAEKGLLCAPSRAFLLARHRLALPDHQTFDWTEVL